jgi:uncharacterized protein (PEP-CTERM system associated)
MNELLVSPYIILRPTSRTQLQTGYRYRDVWYRERLADSRTEHIGFFQANYELTSKLFLTANYDYTNQHSEREGFNRHLAAGGFRYEYADKSFIHAKGGNTWVAYDSGRNVRDPYWDAGISYTKERTNLMLSTVVRTNTDDPLTNTTKEISHSFRINQNIDRARFSLGLNYVDYINTVTDQKEKRKVGGDTSIEYQLLEPLKLSTYFLWERYDYKLQNSYTRKISTGAGLTYQFPHDLSLAVNYQFIDYESPGIYEDNKQINRVVFQLRKVF